MAVISDANIMKSFGMSSKNIAGVLGADHRVEMGVSLLERKIGIISNMLEEFNNLFERVDTYIVQIADRLTMPDKTLLGSPKENKQISDKCKSLITALRAVVDHRLSIAEDKPNDIELSEDVKTAVGSLIKDINMIQGEYVPNYRTYGIAETDNSVTNLFISMADLIEQMKGCTGKRIINFSQNTASSPGKDKLGTKTFKSKVIGFLQEKATQALVNEYLEKATVMAYLKTKDDIVEKKKYLRLVNRLRILRNLPPFDIDSDPEIKTLLSRAERLKAGANTARSGGGGGSRAGAGGGLYSMGGGYRKTRRSGRKSRKITKTIKSRKASKARKTHKNNRHQ